MKTPNQSTQTGENSPTPDPKNSGVISPEGIEAGNSPVEPGQQYQPVEIETLPSGQMVVTPANLPAPSRQRLVWLSTLLKNPKALLGFGIVSFFILMALFAPFIAPGDPNEFVGIPNQPPSTEHWLGTEGQGKDVYRQTIWGAQSSLTIGFATGFLITVVSSLIGMSAGFFRGRIDDVLTLLTNLFLVIPGLPLLIILSAYLQPSNATIILALAFTGWAFGARVKRAQTLSLREKDFVAAARVSGESSFRIIFREILPNMTSLIMGSFISSTTYAIGAATALSFIGLGNVSDVTWGTNLYWAQNGGAILQNAWWAFVPSGLCVALVAFGLSFINYALDEVTNPRLRAEKELNNVLKGTTFRKTRTRATPVLRLPK
ncbi:MAG: binding-protein-dependent transport system inner rane component [Chloroflexi bacterium]|jgi:peptide/nickel transport system permease protein|nr:binding-protein-dependent transport system inner rane component [Chloroflexota bacterium]